MRLLGALATFLLGLALTATGIVNQIENQPITEITAEFSEQITEPYLLVPNRLLTSYPGEPHIAVQGVGEVVVIKSRESDVRAWLSGITFRELRLTVDASAERARLASVAKAGTEVAVALGSDLWAEEQRQPGRVAFRVPVNNETALLIAGDGLNPAPARVVLTWDVEEVDYPIAPIIYVGLAIMFVGALAALAVFVITRRKMGPRRLRPPRRPRRRGPGRVRSQVQTRPSGGRRAASSTSAMLIAGLALSGCAVEYENPILSPSPSNAPEVLTASVTEGQAGRILEKIAEVVAVADEALNREQLEARLTGPALEMRSAAYNLARRSEEIAAPEPILAKPVQLMLPSATDSWPRYLMAVTGNPPESSLQLLVLRQESVRDDYMLWHYSELLPGTEFPEVAAPQLGAVSLRVDNRFLAFPVAELAQLVGDVLNNFTNSSYADIVDLRNPYLSSVAQAQLDLVSTLDNAEVSFEHELADDRIALLSTVNGGALVAFYMKDRYQIVPREAGDAVAISGPEALLLGSSGSTTGVQTRYGAMLVFYVPSANSTEQLRLLAATQQLLGVANLG
jgi:hypothetical protein